MNSIEVKIQLLRRGLTLQQIARELRTGSQSEQAVRVMLSQMVNGRRFYPTLAKRVEERYGLRLTRPANLTRRAA